MKAALIITLIGTCLFNFTFASLAGITYVITHDADQKCLEDFVVSDCKTPAWGLFHNQCETCDSIVEGEGIVYKTTVNCDTSRLVTTAWKNENMVMNATCHDYACWITVGENYSMPNNFDECYNLHTSGTAPTTLNMSILLFAALLIMVTLA